jgi:hypothetical protein
MKTLSGTVKLLVLAVVAVVAAITFRAFAQPVPTPTLTEPPDPLPAQEPFVLIIKPRHVLAQGTTEKAFKDLLNNGHYPAANRNKVHMRHKDPHEADEYLPTGSGTSSNLDIKTDKVTVSKAAQSIADTELTVISPHVTIQVASPSAADIEAVLKLLE